MSRNLDDVKTFYDPHPGLAGAVIPIPEEVRKVANELEGKSMTLRKAVKLIQEATNGTVEVSENFDFIYLELTEASSWRHGFRVIRFK